MRIISGIQPTGNYHLGNYLGAVQSWVKLQDQHESLFFIADLHAITIPQDPEALKQATFDKVVELLALGINPEKSSIFVQSQVKEHAELAWILSTITPLGDLERMTQYKDKAKKQKGELYAGLLNYPILMAADILLYKAKAVPVGKDQIQHLEFTRNLAQKFNARFGSTFEVPEPLVPESGGKILSLQDPARKMSKSDPEDSRLSLLEDPDSIKKKILGAVTDTGKQITYNPEKKPGISNLITIYSLMGGIPAKDVEKKFKNKGYAIFKKALAELLIEKLGVFRKKYQELKSRDLYIHEIIKQGRMKAQSIAESTMEDVRKKVGFLPL